MTIRGETEEDRCVSYVVHSSERKARYNSRDRVNKDWTELRP